MTEPGRTTARHVFVSGRVQGVFYRATTRDEARRLGLGGWVRNLPDGRVEAWVEGPEEAVEQMMAWFPEGPPYARVSEIKLFSRALSPMESAQMGALARPRR